MKKILILCLSFALIVCSFSSCTKTTGGNESAEEQTEGLLNSEGSTGVSTETFEADQKESESTTANMTAGCSETETETSGETEIEELTNSSQPPATEQNSESESVTEDRESEFSTEEKESSCEQESASSPVSSADESREPDQPTEDVPSEELTIEPSSVPSEELTSEPSSVPSEELTSEPSSMPSEEVTSEPSSMPSEEPTDEPSSMPSEEVTGEIPSEPASEESGEASSESMTQDESASESGSEEESTPIGTLDEELLAVGIVGYDSYKLWLISLYYDFYYIGGELPDNRQIAKGVRALFDEYFPDIDAEDQETMTTAVIACYQRAVGDRYATYFDEKSYKEQKTDQNAEFVGIGVYVSYDLRENSVQVLSVFKGTPAAEAGILPGDYLVSVDGVGIEEIGYAELVNRIRGEVDSYVTVGVLRDGAALSFTMQRKQVEGVSVTYRQLEQDEKIGYVKIEQFDSKTAAQFRLAIDDLIQSGVEGFVFDLRGNPGGEVGAIVDVLDYLLPDGKVIAYFRYDNSTGIPDKVYYADDGHEVNLPMTVLCDNYTASAGELFTAALRDHEAATVIGVQTYGKGTAQSLIELGDGTAFTISAARYDPPSGVNYEGVGITPHITVELSEEAAAINVFLRDDLIDNQLQAAVSEINRLRQEALQ